MGFVDILFAIFGLSILVVVHESGHYLVARASGMRVTRYSIGIGPVLFKHRPHNSPTTYQVCALPFLAYVQIAGMNPHEDVDPEDPGIYPNKSLFARMATIVAGPGANYLIAIVLTLLLALWGWPTDRSVEPMTVGSLSAGFPAEQAGMEVGDVIVEVNGRPIRNVEELIEVTSPRAGKATEYVVRRDGRRLPPMFLTPVERQGRGLIGVMAKGERVYEAMSLGDAARAAVSFPVQVSMAQVVGIRNMISERTTEGLTGPVGMAKIVGDQAQEGLPEYIRVLILLSIALGLFNLLPFPALDGGRLVFLAYEAVTRQKPNERVEAMIHTVGILFLLTVLVLVTFRDIVG